MSILHLEIWQNKQTDELEVCTNKNNYGACYDTWELIARQEIYFMRGDGLTEIERIYE